MTSCCHDIGGMWDVCSFPVERNLWIIYCAAESEWWCQKFTPSVDLVLERERDGGIVSFTHGCTLLIVWVQLKMEQMFVSYVEDGTFSRLWNNNDNLSNNSHPTSILPTFSWEHFHYQSQDHTGFWNRSAVLFSWRKTLQAPAAAKAIPQKKTKNETSRGLQSC